MIDLLRVAQEALPAWHEESVEHHVETDVVNFEKLPCVSGAERGVPALVGGISQPRVRALCAVSKARMVVMGWMRGWMR